MRLPGLAHDSIVDGPGLRLTVFFQGCHHHCPGCQNPATWPFEGGEEYTVEQLVAQAKKSPLCRGRNPVGRGTVRSGRRSGAAAAALKAAGYEVAAYTGFTFEQLLNADEDRRALLQNLDVLVDGAVCAGGDEPGTAVSREAATSGS